MHDLIIVGAGPAAMSAAIYASRRELKTIIISKDIGGQLLWSAEIENYPGFAAIRSSELIEKMHEQVKRLGIEIKISEVKSIAKTAVGFDVYTNQEKYAATAVIIAIGLLPRRLAIPGEEKFAGRGVSYCANCDGPFFKNKVVAVIGGGNSALDAAEVLSKIARQVYLVHRRDEFRAFEDLVSAVEARANIKVIRSAQVKEFSGEEKLTGLGIKTKNGHEETLAADGAFIEIGRIAHTDIIKDLAERNGDDRIIVDAKGATSCPGIFAAGDVTATPYKQITVAVGQGTTAALSAYEFIQLKAGRSVSNFLDRGKKEQGKEAV